MPCLSSVLSSTTEVYLQLPQGKPHSLVLRYENASGKCLSRKTTKRLFDFMLVLGHTKWYLANVDFENTFIEAKLTLLINCNHFKSIV